MSEADKDGRIAQVVADMHACLGMELNESVRESQSKVDGLLRDIKRPMRSLNLPPRISNPIFRRLRWLPEPAYYWLLDRLTDLNGWRPLFYRGGRR